MELAISLLQNAAKITYCLGVAQIAVEPTAYRKSSTIVNIGSALLLIACALDVHAARAGSMACFLIACMFMRAFLRDEPPRACISIIALLEAVEISSMLMMSTGYLVSSQETFAPAVLYMLIIAWAMINAVLYRGALYRLLALGDRLSFAALSLGLILSLQTWPRTHMPIIPLGPYSVHLTDVAWLAAFLALSANPSIYDKAKGASSLQSFDSVIPVAICCVLTSIDLTRGVALTSAACLTMVRRGQSARDVASFGLAPVILALTLKRMGFDPVVKGAAWTNWTWLRGFDFPMMSCLVTAAVCTGIVCADRILHTKEAGIMAPFLCVTWSVELILDALMALVVRPGWPFRGFPFLAAIDIRYVPLLPAVGMIVAIACDLHASRILASEQTEPNSSSALESTGT